MLLQKGQHSSTYRRFEKLKSETLVRCNDACHFNVNERTNSNKYELRDKTHKGSEIMKWL